MRGVVLAALAAGAAHAAPADAASRQERLAAMFRWASSNGATVERVEARPVPGSPYPPGILSPPAEYGLFAAQEIVPGTQAFMIPSKLLFGYAQLKAGAPELYSLIEGVYDRVAAAPHAYPAVYVTELADDDLHREFGLLIGLIHERFYRPWPVDNATLLVAPDGGVAMPDARGAPSSRGSRPPVTPSFWFPYLATLPPAEDGFTGLPLYYSGLDAEVAGGLSEVADAIKGRAETTALRVRMAIDLVLRPNPHLFGSPSADPGLEATWEAQARWASAVVDTRAYHPRSMMESNSAALWGVDEYGFASLRGDVLALYPVADMGNHIPYPGGTYVSPVVGYPREELMAHATDLSQLGRPALLGVGQLLNNVISPGEEVRQVYQWGRVACNVDVLAEQGFSQAFPDLSQLTSTGDGLPVEAEAVSEVVGGLRAAPFDIANLFDGAVFNTTTLPAADCAKVHLLHSPLGRVGGRAAGGRGGAPVHPLLRKWYTLMGQLGFDVAPVLGAPVTPNFKGVSEFPGEEETWAAAPPSMGTLQDLHGLSTVNLQPDVEECRDKGVCQAVLPLEMLFVPHVRRYPCPTPFPSVEGIPVEAEVAPRKIRCPYSPFTSSRTAPCLPCDGSPPKADPLDYGNDLPVRVTNAMKQQEILLLYRSLLTATLSQYQREENRAIARVKAAAAEKLGEPVVSANILHALHTHHGAIRALYSGLSRVTELLRLLEEKVSIMEEAPVEATGPFEWFKIFVGKPVNETELELQWQEEIRAAEEAEAAAAAAAAEAANEVDEEDDEEEEDGEGADASAAGEVPASKPSTPGGQGQSTAPPPTPEPEPEPAKPRRAATSSPPRRRGGKPVEEEEAEDGEAPPTPTPAGKGSSSSGSAKKTTPEPTQRPASGKRGGRRGGAPPPEDDDVDVPGEEGESGSRGRRRAGPPGGSGQCAVPGGDEGEDAPEEASGKTAPKTAPGRKGKGAATPSPTPSKKAGRGYRGRPSVADEYEDDGGDAGAGAGEEEDDSWMADVL